MSTGLQRQGDKGIETDREPVNPTIETGDRGIETERELVNRTIETGR